VLFEPFEPFESNQDTAYSKLFEFDQFESNRSTAMDQAMVSGSKRRWIRSKMLPMTTAGRHLMQNMRPTPQRKVNEARRLMMGGMSTGEAASVEISQGTANKIYAKNKSTCQSIKAVDQGK
ncbi:hypothetical protein BX616_009087, partial [Lobosporangium transversale]